MSTFSMFFDQVGLFDGPSSAQAKGWALIQSISGLICTITGSVLLLTKKRGFIDTTNPTFSFVINHSDFTITPFQRKLSLEPFFTPFVSTWAAGLTTLLGIGFFFLGILLLIAVHEKSVQKCTMWLAGTFPLCLAVFCCSMYNLYLEINFYDLTNHTMWAFFVYALQLVYNFRQECIQINENRHHLLDEF